MIVLMMVGSVFIIFGSLLLAINIHFLRNGKVLKGKIVGIEKYQSYGRNKRTQVFYRPIVEYHFNGSTIKFACSFGSSAISYRIGERVSLLSLNKGPEYVRLNSKTLWVFPAVFVIIGTIVAGIYLYSESSLQMKLGVVIFILAAIYYGFYNLKKKKLLDSITENMLRASVLNSKGLAEKDIFYSQAEISKELQRTYKYSLPLTIIIATALGYAASSFYEELKPRSLEYLDSLLSDPGKVVEFNKYAADKPLLGFLVCLFFGILMLYSIFYQLRKR